MGVIKFPEEVQHRLDFVDRVGVLERQCAPQLNWLLKNKALAPISIGTPLSTSAYDSPIQFLEYRLESKL
jgi:hypothetical protein